MSDSWDDIASWWIREVEDDHAYVDDVLPAVDLLLEGTAGSTLDLGCGEGQIMRRLPGTVVGVDLSFALLREARTAGPVVCARLPDLSWLGGRSFARAVSVYLLDLIEDDQAFFASVARVVRPGGHLVTVINHPVYTAPGSAPVFDGEETLWRWGRYFARGSSTEPAGERDVEFFHRPLGDLLSNAAHAGWDLEHLVERGLSPATVARFPAYHGQETIPRLLGVKWRRAGPDTGHRPVA